LCSRFNNQADANNELFDCVEVFGGPAFSTPSPQLSKLEIVPIRGARIAGAFFHLSLHLGVALYALVAGTGTPN